MDFAERRRGGIACVVYRLRSKLLVLHYQGGAASIRCSAVSRTEKSALATVLYRVQSCHNVGPLRMRRVAHQVLDFARLPSTIGADDRPFEAGAHAHCPVLHGDTSWLKEHRF